MTESNSLTGPPAWARCPRCDVSLLEGHVERPPLVLSVIRRWFRLRMIGECSRCGYRRVIRKVRR